MNVDNFLAHYGVKGMKWGVTRKSGTPKLSRRERLEEAYSAKYGEAVAKTKVESRLKTEKILAISAGVLATTVVAAVVGKKLHTEFAPVTVKAGTAFQNVNGVGSKLDTDGILFTTFKSKDNAKYRTRFAEELIGRGHKQAYATVLQNKTTIKAPSKRATEKMFKEWNQSRGMTRDMKYTNYLRSMQLNPNRNPEPGSFIDFVQKRGYNALQDRLDQTGSYKAQLPLMVFNGSKTLSSFGSVVVKDILSKT